MGNPVIQRTPFSLAIMALGALSLSTYVDAFGQGPYGFIDAIGRAAQLGVLIGSLAAGAVFLGLAVWALFTSSRQERLKFYFVIFPGLFVIDALSQLGKLQDKSAYLTTFVGVMGGVIIAFAVESRGASDRERKSP